MSNNLKMQKPINIQEVIKIPEGVTNLEYILLALKGLNPTVRPHDDYPNLITTIETPEFGINAENSWLEQTYEPIKEEEKEYDYE